MSGPEHDEALKKFLGERDQDWVKERRSRTAIERRRARSGRFVPKRGVTVPALRKTQ